MVTRSIPGNLKYTVFHTTLIALCTYQEATKQPIWRQVMSEEIDALMANGSWDMGFSAKIMGSERDWLQMDLSHQNQTLWLKGFIKDQT